MVDEPEFKHLKVPECGPHCRAKDNGSGKHVMVQHCNQCHMEHDMVMDDRPAHGKNRVSAAIDKFTTNPIPSTLHITPEGLLLEQGRQLASERDDLIAKGVDPKDLLIPMAPPLRLKSCVHVWPNCEEDTYNPSCCRFPKPCSCRSYSLEYVKPEDLEGG